MSVVPLKSLRRLPWLMGVVHGLAQFGKFCFLPLFMVLLSLLRLYLGLSVLLRLDVASHWVNLPPLLLA